MINLWCLGHDNSWVSLPSSHSISKRQYLHWGVVRHYKRQVEQNNLGWNDHKSFQLKLNNKTKDGSVGKVLQFKKESFYKLREAFRKARRALGLPGIKLLEVGIQARFSGKRAPQLTEFRKGLLRISTAWKEGEQLVLQAVQPGKYGCVWICVLFPALHLPTLPPQTTLNNNRNPHPKPYTNSAIPVKSSPPGKTLTSCG